MLPVTAITLSWPTSRWSLLLFMIYPLLIVRTAVRRSGPAGQTWPYAIFCVLAKWPQLLGQIKYLANRCVGRRTHLIEYKGTVGASACE